ncbi:MAG: PEP-utilizing enzyme [Caldisericia bacterium]
MYSVFGDRFLNQWERVADSTTLATMRGNIKSYRIRKRPRNLRFAGFLSLQSFVFSPRLTAYFRAFNKPKEYLDEILEKEEWLKENIKSAFESYESLNSLSETLGELYNQFISISLMATYASEKARVGLDKLFAPYPEMKEKVNLLERSLPGNITVQMGLDMFELSGFPEITESSGYSEFSVLEFSKLFSNKWDDFMEKYGFRCPMEIDMKSVRPWENPKMVFDQIKQMSRITETDMKPDFLYKKSVAAREDTYLELMEFAKEKGFSPNLAKNYEVTITLGGYRETHKYFIVMIIDAMKKEILKVAEKLVSAGRLNNAYEIFDLKVTQIDEILKNPSIDIHKLREENTRHIRKTEHIKHFPTIIDSRGRIPVPPKPEEKEGQLLGEAISVGRIKGHVKVLKSPTEKEILPGEVLVARTTDPGWTPLFINAAAVVLEIGGMLQHGAMVAREYGKPCVAGVINATEKLKDGMIIEVDGSSGIITIIDET